jgi:hypothetical protein
MLKIFEFFTKEDIKRFFHYTIFGVCNLIVILIVLWFYKGHFEVKIGVVNITGIVNKFVDIQTKQNYSAVDLKAKVRSFSILLEKIMNDLSVEKKVILMPAEAVIVGAKDYTAEVQKQLFKLNNVISVPDQIGVNY